MKKYGLFNIISSILLFIVLLFFNISENFISIMVVTLIVGWLVPYISLIIAGICFLKDDYYNLSLTINILSLILNILIILLLFKILDNNLIVCIVEYSLLSLISLSNTIIIIIYKIKNRDTETYKEIKKLKKQNNGAIK